MTDKQIIIYKKECYNEPHCSLNQVLEQLNAYKMEADEGKEINAELKAENDELKKQLKPLQDKYFKGLDTIAIAGLAKLILQKISECEGNDGK